MATKTSLLELNKPATGEAPDIALLNENADILDAEVGGRPKTVNGESPDAAGNIEIEEVPYAGNLRSDQTQRSVGTYLRRTTAGGAALQSGDAWLIAVRGHRDWTGQSDEVLTVTSSNTALELDIDRETYLAYAQPTEELITMLTYSGSSWSMDPALYGVTVTGTPAAGDTLTIYYAPEARGTIVQSTPQRFVATGWNLFEPAAGYARVVRYSDEYGYRIVGAYTGIQWSATENGARTSLTPSSSGLFQVPADGFVHVSGGTAASTAIYTTWSDMQAELPGGAFESYREDVIDLASVMSNYFAFGLCQVGNYADEINLSTGVATSWIDRMLYTPANLAAAEAAGRPYEADENYIYQVRAAAVTNPISIANGYAGDEYGMEFIDGSQAAVTCETLYGANLKNKLERNVLTISQQTLSASEQAQVMTNLGMSLEELCNSISGAVSAGLVSNVNTKISTSATLRMWKCGHMLELSMMPRATEAMQDGDVIFTLAEGVRPVMAVYEPLLNEAYRVYQSKGISISASSGDVTLRLNADLPAGYFRVHMVFLIY